MSVLILTPKPKTQFKSDSPYECPWCRGHYGEEYNIKKQAWKEDKWISPRQLRCVCKHCKHGVIFDYN